jgi:hypothetical protein
MKENNPQNLHRTKTMDCHPQVIRHHPRLIIPHHLEEFIFHLLEKLSKS